MHHSATCFLFLFLVTVAGCTAPGAKHAFVGNGYAEVTENGQGAIASVNPLATRAGLRAFAAGGNAIDAALAVAFTLGVVDSHNSGIGGGSFIIARLASGEIIALDGREMAPGRATPDMYVRDGEPQPRLSKTGALAVGIPGSVAALHHLQTQAGELTFSDVLLPAADLAERGFAIDASMAMRLARVFEDMQAFPATARIFSNDNGQPLQAGDWLVQPDLAQSYRALARSGPAWFYRGEFASRTGNWMQENGGIISAADFADYRMKQRQPVRSTFNGYTIVGFPPPSSGGIHVGQMLNMLGALDWAHHEEADRYHLMAEVMRSVFADRARWLGDGDFVDVPRGLLADAYARERAAAIRLDRVAETVSHGQPPAAAHEPLDRHTTHFATADRQGNWVAVTSTLNTSFGSKVVVPGTGILLNNQMDDFVIQPGVPNAFGLMGSEANMVAPGKRPLSSMSPTLVLKENQPVLSLGAAGGPTIISQVVQILMHHLGAGLPIDEAVGQTRVHHQWQPETLFVEPALPADIRDDLTRRGHTLKELGSFGGSQAIAVDDGQFVPVTEPRIIERNAQP